MKSIGYSIKIKVEVLDMDSVPVMVCKALEGVKKEFKDRKVEHGNPGDSVKWEIVVRD